MEEIETGVPVTAAQAIEIVEAAGFPPQETIRFPDGILPPDPVPRGGFFDPARPANVPDVELQRLQRYVVRDRRGGPLGRIVTWFRDAIGDDAVEEFALRRRIAFVDASAGVVIVPAFLAPFRTDLTSVPRLFTWLVPRTGLHLPAALLHDGLVHGADEPQTYIARERIEREEADRIFRDAMGELGTSLLRRWLIWTTVMLATLASSRDRARWIPTIALTVVAIVTLGTLATIDLTDHRAPLPWMGERPLVAEVLAGAVAAVAVSALVSLAWGRRWLVGFISSLAVALLLHVTVMIALVSSAFGLLEGIGDRDGRKALAYGSGLAALLGALAAVVVLTRAR